MLYQHRASSHFVGSTGWVAGSVLNNPANGTVVADSGAIADAGHYFLAAIVAADADFVYDIQHRNAANDTTLKTQRRYIKASIPDTAILPVPIEIAVGERVRLVSVGGLTGNVQGSVFTEHVLGKPGAV